MCSEMAARGLDNSVMEHVVLLDFPTSAVDYLHRAGRTARAGSKWRLTSFVTKMDVGLTRAILKAGSGREDYLESARVARESESIGRERKQDALRKRGEMLSEEAWGEMGETRRGGGRGSGRFRDSRRSAGRGGGGSQGRGGEEIEVGEGEGRRRSG